MSNPTTENPIETELKHQRKEAQDLERTVAANRSALSSQEQQLSTIRGVIMGLEYALKQMTPPTPPAQEEPDAGTETT